MLQEALPAQIIIKIMRLQRIYGNAQPLLQILKIHAADQESIIAYDFRGHIFHNFIQQLPVILNLCQKIIACGDICYRDAGFSRKISDAHEKIIFILFQGLDIQVGAGSDYTHHFPLDKPLCQLRILHLLTDGNLIPLAYKTAQIALHRMIRDAAHGGAFFHTAVLSGKRKLKLFGYRKRILKKHFVEVSETIEKNTVCILPFRLHILLHHRRHFCHVFRFSFAFPNKIRKRTSIKYSTIWLKCKS